MRPFRTVNNIRVLTLPGGPLPQLIEEGLPPLTRDIPAVVSDDGDGIFNGSDYIIFFAEGPDELRYTEDGIIYEFNPYDRLNYVFIGSDGENGKRIVPRAPVTSGGATLTSYSDLAAYENTVTNLLSSGRNWYGERFGDINQRQFNFSFPNAVSGGEIEITSRVMAQSFGSSRFSIFINGIRAGDQPLDPVPDFTDPPSNNPFLFSVKGRERTDTFLSEIISGDITVELEFEPAPVTISNGYLDYLVLSAESRMRFDGEQEIFEGPSFTGENTFTVEIESSQDIEVWDVSDVMHPQRISDFEKSENLVRFNDSGKENKRYAVFNTEVLPKPELSGTVNNRDILAGSPELLIVTSPEFLAAANRLADYRTAEGISADVMVTEDIYNVFGSVRADPTAIRNAARWHYEKGNLRYLLLMGKASFDYLGILPFRSNFVPTYESRTVLDPLATFASDDYFGFMEPGEGSWEEIPGGNHSLELGIGRIPVISPEEAQTAVDKIIAYESGDETRGSWRTSLLFVADDEDGNLHHRQADRLANLVDTTDLQYQNKRLFLGSFEQQTTGGGETSPGMTEALKREIWKGALIVNYTGHGNVTSWGQEQFFTPSVIDELRNRDKLPLYVTATCEFGRFDDPREISGAELLIKNPTGGGIGILSTCRPVFSSSNFNLNEAFYTALTDPSFKAAGRLGDLMRITKNNSVDLAIDSRKVGNRNFTLFGDPSMPLGIPQEEIRINSIIANGEPADTLQAGEEISVEGEIVGRPGFNGEIDIRLRDKAVELQTKSNPVYRYNERTNTLFSGKSRVRNGKFEVSFIIPRNVSNKPGYAQFFMYAVHEANTEAASGTEPVIVSGEVNNNSADQAG
ncbi:MAG: type IX secretion system sortase PorU, partial [Cyclobacteriaceae bacterium]